MSESTSWYNGGVTEGIALTFEIAWNQPEFDYRRAEGLNQSSFKKILDSPAHYQAALKNRLIPTPAMKMGTAVHSLVLDGEKAFNSLYFNRKKEGKDLTVAEMKEALDKKNISYKNSAKKAELEELLYPGGKPLDRRTGLSEDEYADVQGMAESLRRLEWYSGTDAEYIKRNEVSIYWEQAGVPFKARLDSILIDEGIVLDLKTTDSAEPELFTKKVIGLGYDFQAAAYTAAAERAFGKPFRFMFAAVERKAPYTVAIYEADEVMQAEGRRKFDEAIRIYKECEASGNWPGKEITIGSLSYPSWYKPIETPEPIEDVF